MTHPGRGPLASTLLYGAVCQIGQVLLLREYLGVFQGNELSIGLVLGAWMAWIGIGSRLGARMADRLQRPLRLLALTSAATAAGLPLTVALVRLTRGFFTGTPGATLSLSQITAASFLFSAPICLLLGAQFVFLARVWRESNRSQDTAGGNKTYACEAAGNMLGGLLFTFVMVHELGPLQSATLSGLAMLGSILLAARTLKLQAGGLSVPLRRGLWALPLLAVVALPFLEPIDQWAHRRQWRQFMPQHRLVATRASKHGAIAVVQRGDQYSFFQSGHLAFTAAGPATGAPGLEEQEAAAMAHLAMLQHPRPERVLLIGGGLRGTLGEMIRHPVRQVDYVELDGALTEAARPYLPPATIETLNDPRVRLLHTDGRRFMKTTDARYDLIVLDVPEPSTAALNRFYTLEFFREAKARLRPGGSLVIGAASTPDLRGTAIVNRNATLYHTLNAVFPRVLVGGQRFLYFVTSRDPDRISVDPAALRERYQARGIESREFSERHFDVLLRAPQLQRVNWVVRHHGRSARAHLDGPARSPLAPLSIPEIEQAAEAWAPVHERHFVNSDFKPIGYYYTLMFWDERTGSGRGQAFQRLLRADARWIAPALGLLLAGALGAQWRARRRGRPDGPVRFAVGFAVFSTGLSTMALQIALLFAFQSLYGFVYERVGLIVALFMGGLALGTLWTQRCVVDKANVRTLARVQGGIALLALLLAVALPRAALAPTPALVFGLFSALTFGAGLINGVDFPLATACCLAWDRRAEKSTARVYGLELSGACLGAVLASVVIAPIWGIVACCLLAAAVNATGCAMLWGAWNCGIGVKSEWRLDNAV